METKHTPETGHSSSVTENTQNCHHASKWMALVNDQNVYAPTKQVGARVLKTQANIPHDHVLVRDHDSGRDIAFDDDHTLDLGEGNVFVTMPRCEFVQCDGSVGRPKLAWFVDDHPEITLLDEQTGRTIRELFSLTVATRLFRDDESTQDEVIAPEKLVHFQDGPVFYSRRPGVGLTITVNKQTFGAQDGVKPEMTGRDIGNLVTDQPCEVKQLVKGQLEIDIPLNAKVQIKGCEEFKVIRCNVVGGYEQARIDRELAILRENGASVDFIQGARPAVIYRRVPTRPGYGTVAETDVLVVVPPAFPGAFLDGAYLPKGSPLLGKVAGAARQGDLQADGRIWELVSYHPHNGGGGSAWNPNRHGIHSYFSEVLSWIQKAN